MAEDRLPDEFTRARAFARDRAASGTGSPSAGERTLPGVPGRPGGPEEAPGGAEGAGQDGWDEAQLRAAEEALDRMPYGSLFSAGLQVTLMVRGRRSLPEGPVDNLVIDYRWDRFGDHAGQWVATRAVAVVQNCAGGLDDDPVLVTWDHASDKRPKWVEGLAAANVPVVGLASDWGAP